MWGTILVHCTSLAALVCGLHVGDVGGGAGGQRDLAFVHVPMNFGNSVALTAAVGSGSKLEYQNVTQAAAGGWKEVTPLVRPGAPVWGPLNPDLQATSEYGYPMYYTPQKHWPKDLADRYFGNRTVFGLLRDPYDRLVGIFRAQASGTTSEAAKEARKAVSEREGSLEREGEEYLKYYDGCDINSWVKAELAKYKRGDRFRGNCHLLPQAEFFAGPNGVTLPVDTRWFPQSFNEAMRNHGYDARVDAAFSGLRCEVSAWSLDAEAKQLIKEVYADDLGLLCKHFGYCDRDEVTCLPQIPNMCGGAPKAS